MKMIRRNQIERIAQVLGVDPARVYDFYRYACRDGLIATPPRGTNCPLLQRDEIIKLIARIVVCIDQGCTTTVPRHYVCRDLSLAEVSGIEIHRRLGGIKSLTTLSAEHVRLCLKVALPEAQALTTAA